MRLLPKRNRATLPLSLLILTPLLASCNLAPNYKRPNSTLPTSYPQDTETNSQKAQRITSEIGWQDFFLDPKLKKLIRLTATNNRDLAAQMAAITQARGQYDVQNAALFPTINVGGGGQFTSPSDEGGFSFAPGSGRSVGTLRYFQTSIGFSSYEIDLWGRIRNLTRAQQEQTLNAVENLRNLWITTLSQLAETYIQWGADQELLDLARATARTRQKTYKLTESSYQNGEENALTLAQMAQELEQARSDIEQQERAVALDKHALTLLVGQELPADITPPTHFNDKTILLELPAGLPSDILEQRPDIQAAEHLFKGDNAAIGSARAAFFPRVSLTASEGTSSLQFRTLFSHLAETWGVAPSISIPVLTWGKNSGNLLSAKALAAQASAQYQKTVQNAFKEVSDALTARETFKRQDVHMTNLVNNAQIAYNLAKQRFHAGIDNYLTTLEQERIVYQAQKSQILIHSARYQNMITLYRALGGGWSPKTTATPPTTPPSSHPFDPKLPS